MVLRWSVGSPIVIGQQALGHGTAPAARGLEDLGGVSPEERYQAALSCWSRLEEERAAFSDSTATQLAALEVRAFGIAFQTLGDSTLISQAVPCPIPPSVPSPSPLFLARGDYWLRERTWIAWVSWRQLWAAQVG